MTYRFTSILSLILVLAFGLNASAQEPDLTPVSKWLKFQSSVRTFEGSFTQTRTLTTVRTPQQSSGKMYADMPSKFRWDAGDTVAIRNGDKMTLIDEKGKKAKISDAAGAGGPAAALNFASGNFATTIEEFEKGFEILDLTKSGSFYVLETKPKDRKMARAIREATFYIHDSHYYLGGMDMQFRDGSNVATRFSSMRFNGSIPSSRFTADLTGYKTLGE